MDIVLGRLSGIIVASAGSQESLPQKESLMPEAPAPATSVDAASPSAIPEVAAPEPTEASAMAPMPDVLEAACVGPEAALPPPSDTASARPASAVAASVTTTRLGSLEMGSFVITGLLVVCLGPVLGFYGVCEGAAVALLNFPVVGITVWRWPVLPAINVPPAVLGAVWRMLSGGGHYPYARSTEAEAGKSEEARPRAAKAAELWTALCADQSSDPRPRTFFGQVS